jgi:hypothetical protein
MWFQFGPASALEMKIMQLRLQFHPLAHTYNVYCTYIKHKVQKFSHFDARTAKVRIVMWILAAPHPQHFSIRHITSSIKKKFNIFIYKCVSLLEFLISKCFTADQNTVFPKWGAEIWKCFPTWKLFGAFIYSFFWNVSFIFYCVAYTLHYCTLQYNSICYDGFSNNPYRYFRVSQNLKEPLHQIFDLWFFS